MKRLKLKHGYHDAVIRVIRYHDNEDVAIEVDLCSCCNPSAGPATLSPVGLRNFADVKAALERSRQANAGRGYVDEIVAVMRHDKRGYQFDLATAGPVHVDARGLHEA